MSFLVTLVEGFAGKPSYGVRVVSENVPIADALIPGRLEEATSRAAGGGRTDWTGWPVTAEPRIEPLVPHCHLPSSKGTTCLLS